MSQAADTLRDLLVHADPHVKFKAARAVLELGVRLKESVELASRVTELEARLGGDNSGG
jgi:hypothetical protein